MATSISLDLRKKIVSAYYSTKYTQQEIADIFGVALASVKRFLKLDREKGDLSRKKQPGAERLTDENDIAYIKMLVEKNPDATLSFYCGQLEKRSKKIISESTMSRIISRLGFTRKKKSLRIRTR